MSRPFSNSLWIRYHCIDVYRYIADRHRNKAERVEEGGGRGVATIWLFVVLCESF